MIERSGNDIDYRLQKLRADYNLETSDGKVGYLEAAAKVIAPLSSAIEQDVYVTKLCREFEIDKSAFQERLKKLNRQRSVFPSDQALLKALYLSTFEAAKKWTMPIRNWGKAYGELAIMYEGRMPE